MNAAFSPTVPPRPDVAPKRGRPRNPETHLSILRATIVLIREIGYDAVTMEGVAEKAGVGKATLYRRWDGKEMLVAEAIKQIANEIPITDTGTLRGDILTVLRTTAAMYRDPATGALLSGLVAAIARSERIAAAVRGGFVAARREALRQVLERWRERGELFPDVDVEILMDMINGPLFYRFLLRGETVSEPVVEAIVDMLLGGVRAPDPYRST